MSLPDLSKLQYYSDANSFKNDGVLYTGTLTFPTSIDSGSFVTTTQSFSLSSAPQFSMLYAFYQEFFDAFQQFNVGSGYNTAQWYQASVDNKIGVTIPSGTHAGVIEATIYPVINGNNVTVTGLINNPYTAAITINALSIPWAFCEYTLTN
jgi:hypothetical protein